MPYKRSDPSVHWPWHYDPTNERAFGIFDFGLFAFGARALLAAAARSSPPLPLLTVNQESSLPIIVAADHAAAAARCTVSRAGSGVECRQRRGGKGASPTPSRPRPRPLGSRFTPGRVLCQLCQASAMHDAGPWVFSKNYRARSSLSEGRFNDILPYSCSAA